MEEAGRFGIAKYRAGGASHLFWLDPQLWEKKVRDPLFLQCQGHGMYPMPVLLRTAASPWDCLAQDHWISQPQKQRKNESV